MIDWRILPSFVLLYIDLLALTFVIEPTVTRYHWRDLNKEEQ